MASPTDVLTAFRAHLVEQGIVRRPGDGPQPGDPPPCFVEPEDGPVAPGQEDAKPEEDDPTLVVSVFWAGAIAAGDDAFRLRGTIDVRFRSRGTAGLKRAAAVASRIRREVFEPGDSPGIGRQGWVMAGVPVIRSGEWGAFSRISSSEAEGYDHVWKAYVEAYAS